jgi:phosphoglycerol transferase
MRTGTEVGSADAATTDVPAAPTLSIKRETGFVAATLAVIGAVYLGLYRPWGGRLHRPISYSYDANFFAMIIKGDITRGGFERTSLLGAPHGQVLFDFPLGTDRLHLVMLRILSLGSNDPYLVLNVAYALTFVLVGVAAYAVLRVLGVRPLLAAAAAVLYDYLPFHFAHGPSHIFLSTYEAVPLGVLLVVWLYRDQIPVVRRTGSTWTDRARWRRLALVGVLVVVIGSASGYYAMFTALLLVGTAAVRALASRSGRPLVVAGAIAGSIAAVLVLNLSPELLYQANHGDNTEVAHRTASESIVYALQPSQLVLPPANSQIRSWTGLGGKLTNDPLASEHDSYLGVFGVLGLVVVLVVALGAVGWGLSRGDRDRADPATERLVSQVAPLACVVVLSLGLAVAGGLGGLFAVFGFTQVRVWARLSIFIGFAALATLALAVQHVVPARDGRSRLALAGVLVALLPLALYDQIPLGAVPTSATAASIHSDRAFVAQMQQSLPKGSMVFQLPVDPFPESAPRGQAFDYDLLKPYVLGNGSLRWSYGGLKGREADWQVAWMRPTLDGEIQRRSVEGLAAAGFAAVYVDKFGVPAAAQVETTLKDLVGKPSGLSEDGRLVWYDLRPLRATMVAALGRAEVDRLGQLITTTVWPRFSSGAPPEATQIHQFGTLTGRATLQLVNYGPAARQVSLHFTAAASPGVTTTVRVLGRSVEVTGQEVPTEVRVPLTLPKGTTSVVLDPTGSVTIDDLGVDDPSVSSALPG